MTYIPKPNPQPRSLYGAAVIILWAAMLFMLLCAPSLAQTSPVDVHETAAQRISDEIRQGDYQDAQGQLQRVVAAKPNSALAWFMLAWTDYKLGQMPQAAQDFNKSVAIDPSQDSFQADPTALSLLQANADSQPESYTYTYKGGFSLTFALWIPLAAAAAAVFVFALWRAYRHRTSGGLGSETDRQDWGPNSFSAPPSGPPTGFSSAARCPASSYYTPPPYPAAPQTTIVNQGGFGSDGFVEGMVVADLINSEDRERPVVVEQPTFDGAYSRDFDSTPSVPDYSPPDTSGFDGGSSSFDSGSTDTSGF